MEKNIIAALNELANAVRLCGYHLPSKEDRENVYSHVEKFQELLCAPASHPESPQPDKDADFAALYKELAILEKQSSDRYRKMISDLEEAVKYGRDSINEMAKQISQQNDLIVSLEAQMSQDELVKNDLRKDLMDFKEECHRLSEVAIHWQMKAGYADPDKSGWRQPKIDNL